MFCAECGLEIKGKRYSNGGEDLCSDCHVRQTKKAVLHRSIESVALQNQSRATTPPTTSNDETGTVTRTNNPFTSEDSYIHHVNLLRNKIVLPKLILMGVAFGISLLVLILVSQVVVAVIFLIIYTISFLMIYMKYYQYQPDFDHLVIAEGVLKRRFFRSKNDDRNFKLTQMHNHKNLNLLIVNNKSEVYLRGLAKDCTPNIDKNMLYYIDSKLQMILASRSMN
jgi:uncharacterized membrane protein